jgi:predicted RNA-binding protein YlxR (DUF448 family)
VRLVAIDGRLAVDREGSRPGRGMYLCPMAACTRAARRRDAFAWRLRQRVAVPAALEEEFEVERLAAAWKD